MSLMQIHEARHVLCVCRGNTCRSPMFAALLTKALEEAGHTRTTVESAGTYQETAGQGANEHAIKCMEEINLSLHDHESRWAGKLDLAGYDLFLCLDSEVLKTMRQMAPSLASRMVLVNADKGGITNPFKKGRAAYEECARQISSVVRELVGRLETA